MATPCYGERQMSRTVTMSLFSDQWTTMGLDAALSDAIDGAEYCMERLDGFEFSAGEAWTVAENVALADGLTYHILFRTTYCDQWAPWTSDSTHAELYRVDDPADMAAFASDVAEWDSKPETDPDFEDEPDDDDASDVPNLDAMDASELRAYVDGLADGSIDLGPCTDHIRSTLIRYASDRIVAIGHRLAGRMEAAGLVERQMEQTYQSLPDAYRW